MIFGPHMENFAGLAGSLVAQDAALEVLDAAELVRKIAVLLRDPESRTRIVRNAQRVLASHSGATLRTIKLLLSLRPQATASK